MKNFQLQKEKTSFTFESYEKFHYYTPQVRGILYYQVRQIYNFIGHLDLHVI